MSRKTRKLIWSVPLVAALAVDRRAGCLFAVTLAPNAATAQVHEVTARHAVNLVAEGRRRQRRVAPTSIELTWDAPHRAGRPPATELTYRSEDMATSLVRSAKILTATTNVHLTRTVWLSKGHHELEAGNDRILPRVQRSIRPRRVTGLAVSRDYVRGIRHRIRPSTVHGAGIFERPHSSQRPRPDQSELDCARERRR